MIYVKTFFMFSSQRPINGTAYMDDICDSIYTNNKKIFLQHNT